jgi:hypothetical protein
MIENDGSLIWLDTRWDQAMDVTVQRYEDEDYITFWTGDGSSDGDFGLGTFIMVGFLNTQALSHHIGTITDLVSSWTSTMKYSRK